jgi:hypothetical protein
LGDLRETRKRFAFLDSILATLETMPQLPFKEEVELRPDMRMDAVGPGQPDNSVWMPYKMIQTAQKRGLAVIPGTDNELYAMDRVLNAMPVPPNLRQADIFLSIRARMVRKSKALRTNSNASPSPSGTTGG